MQPEQALEHARAGQLKPVYLVLGEERYLSRRFIEALKALVLHGAVPGLNEDEWNAAETDPKSVLGAARTLPMLAQRRWLCVSDVDRWESKKEGANALDQLDQYVAAPNPSSVLVLCANKLNARRKLLTVAKKEGFLITCDPLDKRSIPGWISQAAKRRGCSLDPTAADLLSEVIGSDLSLLDDVIERLCLYLGGQGLITEETVADLIPVVRPSTVWELLEAVAQRSIARALDSLSKVYDPQDRGLRLVGLLIWSTRQLLQYEAARAAGSNPTAAAKAAGVPPFRSNKLEAQLRGVRRAQLEHWVCVLRDVDLALKGGSKRPPRAILESALIELCGHSTTETLQRGRP